MANARTTASGPRRDPRALESVQHRFDDGGASRASADGRRGSTAPCRRRNTTRAGSARPAVARVLTARLTGGRRAHVQALRAAASSAVRAHKDAARPRLLAARRRRVLRMARSVRFAGACVDGRRALAYDAEQPDVFRAFSRPARSLPRPARKKAPAARPFNKMLEEAAAARAVAAVIGALPDAGAAAVAATSRRLRALTKSDDAYRRRRRRGLDARTCAL